MLLVNSTYQGQTRLTTSGPGKGKRGGSEHILNGLNLNKNNFLVLI